MEINRAESLILESALRYPTLYKDVYRVLDHLFFTIGNGYEWTKDGNITHSGQEDEAFTYYKNSDDIPLRTYEEELSLLKSLDIKPTDTNKYRFLLDEGRMKAIQAKPKEFLRGSCCEDVLFGGRKIYPLSKKYSMIFTFPDNVHESWYPFLWSAALLAGDCTNEELSVRSRGREAHKHVQEFLESKGYFKKLREKYANEESE